MNFEMTLISNIRLDLKKKKTQKMLAFLVYGLDLKWLLLPEQAVQERCRASLHEQISGRKEILNQLKY